MAEVFQGTPAIVSVTIGDQEKRQVTYHVAGRDMDIVKEAVRTALAAIPDEDTPAKPKKARRPRRTKAQMAADTTPTEAPEAVAPNGRKERRELATAGKAWPQD